MLDNFIRDLEDFTAQEHRLSFSFSLAELDKRVSSHELLASNQSKLDVIIQGGIDSISKQPFLAIEIFGILDLICQVCLSSVTHQLNEQACLYLFSDEKMLDSAMEDNIDLEAIIVENNEINISQLIEDQILIALPFSPHHENCINQQLLLINQNKPNPFGILNTLKSNKNKRIN